MRNTEFTPRVALREATYRSAQEGPERELVVDHFCAGTTRDREIASATAAAASITSGDPYPSTPTMPPS